MCVGFSNGFTDYKPTEVEKALSDLKPGSAVGYNRISLFHFAIYLGKTLAPKGKEVPLVWHFYGPADDMKIRVNDFREVTQGTTIRVYTCNCGPSKRSGVITKCLDRLGEGGYNAMTNNCEHIVRWAINGESVSYQSIFTAFPFTMPFQLVRFTFGSIFGSGSSSSGSGSSSSGSGSGFRGSNSSSNDGSTLTRLCSSSCSSYGCSSSSCNSSKTCTATSRHCSCKFLAEHLAIMDPSMDVVVFKLGVSGSKKNTVCTFVFTGDSNLAADNKQALYYCNDCDLYCCKPCLVRCHYHCDTDSKKSSKSPCGCHDYECELRSP